MSLPGDDTGTPGAMSELPRQGLYDPQAPPMPHAPERRPWYARFTLFPDRTSPTYDDGTEGICLSDNPDEVRFCAAEFTGKTDAEVRALLTRTRPGVLDQLRERAASCAPLSCWTGPPALGAGQRASPGRAPGGRKA